LNNRRVFHKNTRKENYKNILLKVLHVMKILDPMACLMSNVSFEADASAFLNVCILFNSVFKSVRPSLSNSLGCTVAEAVSHWLSTMAARVRAWVLQVGFVVDKVEVGQVFSKYFGFHCQSSFHQILLITITRGRYNRPITGRCAEFLPPTMRI
jgi:hypothetical protein